MNVYDVFVVNTSVASETVLASSVTEAERVFKEREPEAVIVKIELVRKGCRIGWNGKNG